jgi:hypothetical protein
MVDLAKNANPYLRIEEHFQEQERMQPICKWMTNLTSWVSQTDQTAKLFLTD